MYENLEVDTQKFRSTFENLKLYSLLNVKSWMKCPGKKAFITIDRIEMWGA